MKFFRKFYWYISAFFKKHWYFILGAVVLGALVFPVMFNVFSTVFRTKKVAYIGRIGTFALANLPRDIQEHISVGLTRVDEFGNVLPGLAERWSIENDGKTYRFILKPRMHWQDGKEIKPEDIQYNFSDVQTVTSSNEIIFRLKDPFIPFPAVVSQPLFRQQKKRVLGAGEYEIRGMRKEGNVIKELQLESPKAKIIYRFYPTEDNAFTAFKKGEVDVLEDMTGTNDIGGWKTVRVEPVIRKDRYLAVFFNLNDSLFEKNTRQALNYALPKSKGEERATGPLNPLSWAYNKTVKTYDEDNGRAVELLLRDLHDKNMTIDLTTTVNFQSEAEEMKREWEALGSDAVNACKRNKELSKKTDCQRYGIVVNLRVTNFPDLSGYQVLLIAQQIPKDPDQYSLWHSTQSTNFSHYKSPKVDKLLEDGRKELDRDQRLAIYQDFQQFLVEDSPAIFLTHPTEFTVKRK